MPSRIPTRYAPRSLSRRDSRAQKAAIKRSRRAYKRGRYSQRKKVASFKSKESAWVRRAKREYGVASIAPSRKLARRTGCSVKALRAIVRKGQGAYYSAGSRPNQSAASWGRARLASALVGGPAALTDRHIIEDGCKGRAKTRRLARRRR